MVRFLLLNNLYDYLGQGITRIVRDHFNSSTQMNSPYLFSTDENEGHSLAASYCVSNHNTSSLLPGRFNRTDLAHSYDPPTSKSITSCFSHRAVLSPPSLINSCTVFLGFRIKSPKCIIGICSTKIPAPAFDAYLSFLTRICAKSSFGKRRKPKRVCG
jgi:hypothetical protein